MIVWPGLRRSVSAISRLFNSAAFDAPLTHTAVPTRAASGTTGTFTRATTSTWPNNDGYMVTGVAGEIGFAGARRVRNWIQAPTENWASAGWVKSGISVSGNRLTATGANGVIYDNAALGMGTGRTAVGSVTLSRVTGTGNIDVSTNGGTTWTTVNVTGARVSVSLTGNINGQFAIRIVTSGDSVDATYPQLEDVTAQTTQTAGEYVSVGVPSDWAGDELVTNGTFDTDTTGWTAANSATLSATGSELTITNAGATYGYAYQALTTVIGAKYILRCVARRGTVATVFLQAGNSAGTGTLVSQNTTSTTNAVLSAEFTATATTTYVTLISDNTNNGTAIFDSVVCKPAYYHGSMVDGVKCFATDINGAAIPSSTLLGYQAEGARTNLCLQSNAFTTTWTEIGTVAATQNLVGPDGGTTGWTLTDNDAGTPEGILQTYGALTAANYAQSIFIKKTSGATSFPVIRLNEPVTPKEALCTVDTNNGVATVWTAYTGSTMVASSASCASHNADWWRVTLVFAATTASWRIVFYPSATTNATQSTGTVSATVTGTCGIYGSQLELGSFASSYIPTTTIAVARNADVLTYTGGDIPNLKTLMAGFRRESGVSSAGVIAQLDDGTANDLVITYLSNATAIRHQGTDGGAVQWNLPVVAVSTYVPGTACKSVQTWTTNDVKAAVNGATLTGDTAATVPTVTQLTVGHQLGALQLDGNVGPIYGWTRNQSQSELNAVTQ